MSKEFRPVSGMMRPHTLRHKHFNRLPNQFSPFIAEQLLNLLVHQEDGTALIYHQNPIRGRFDHKTKLFFRPLALGDIADNRRKTGWLPIIPFHRKYGDGHGNLGAILLEIVDFIFGRLAGLEDLSHDAIPLFFVLFGYQVPCIHPEQLFSREAGQFGKRPIDEEDVPIECGIADRVL